MPACASRERGQCPLWPSACGRAELGAPTCCPAAQMLSSNGGSEPGPPSPGPCSPTCDPDVAVKLQASVSIFVRQSPSRTSWGWGWVWSSQTSARGLEQQMQQERGWLWLLHRGGVPALPALPPPPVALTPTALQHTAPLYPASSLAGRQRLGDPGKPGQRLSCLLTPRPSTGHVDRPQAQWCCEGHGAAGATGPEGGWTPARV